MAITKDKDTEQKTQETADTQQGEIFFFPNTGVGQHRSYRAATREDAEALNQTYLDELKHQQEEAN